MYVYICIYIHILSESNLGLLRGLGWSSFLIIVNSFQLFALVMKSSILDLWDFWIHLCFI